MVWLSGAAILLGYLLGSLPTAHLVTQRFGRRVGDIRLAGDGNAGAANVGRVLGTRWGLAVGAVDIAKGAVAVLIFNVPVGSWDTLSGLGLLSGAAAIAGHVWPVWLRFRGGRGAATAVGVTGALLTAPMLLGALPALVVLWLTRSTTWTLAFICVFSLVVGKAAFGASWGVIAYCVAVFVSVGAVHVWSVKFRAAPAESVSV